MGQNSDELPYVARGSNFYQCNTKANCIDFFHIYVYSVFCQYSLEKIGISSVGPVI